VVRANTECWRQVTTKSAKEEIAKTTGIRWTPLYQLEYWNPVSNLIFGIMYNTLEGIVQHYLTELWRVGWKKKTISRGYKDNVEIQREKSFSESDILELASDIPMLGFKQEMSDKSITPSHFQVFSSTTSTQTPQAASHSGLEISEMWIDDNEYDDPDYMSISEEFRIFFSFSHNELNLIYHCIRYILLST
jgi:hypothetical protein